MSTFTNMDSLNDGKHTICAVNANVNIKEM